VDALRYALRKIGALLAGRYRKRIVTQYDIFVGQADIMANQERSRLIS